MALYRHGDILVAQVDEIPDDLKRLHHLVLAEGEVTGHSHRIAERGSASLHQSWEKGLFLRVEAETATLVHQEHGPIKLKQGVYRVWRQREYTPQAVLTIRD